MKATALMGAHRTGKTTLAKAYADQYAMDFIPMSVSPAYVACGVPMGPVNYATRMDIQDTVIQMYESDIRLALSKNKPIITDRCFLDLLAYALADYPQTPSEKEALWFMNYTYKCLALNAQYFNKVMLIRPGIPLEVCETSWAADMGVVAQVDASMLWAADHAGTVYTLGKECLTLDNRLRMLKVYIDAKL